VAASKYVKFPESFLPPPPGAKQIGDTAAGETLEVSIYLKPAPPPKKPLTMTHGKGRQAADAAIRAFEHQDDLRALRQFAADNGLTVTTIVPSRRLMKLKGTASSFASAFKTKLHIYDDGKRKFLGREDVLMVPDTLLPILRAVLGLDARPAAKQQAFRVPESAVGPAYIPNAVGHLYSFPTSVTGAGQCIGLIELGGGFLGSDVTQAFQGMGLSPPQVVTILVDGATAQFGVDLDADGEVALDIQISGAQAPDAKIVVYFAPNSEQGFVDAVATALSDTVNSPSVISISWGNTETEWSAQGRDAMDDQFQDAASQNVSVFVAAGDHLATNGLTDGQVHVQYPASSPWAIGCGGTVITADDMTITNEIVWNDIIQGVPWGTGGGVSTLYPVPQFQQNANVPVNVTTGNTGRGVPDVAGNASDQSGYVIVINGVTQIWFGTSAVAPLWAGLAALINERANPGIGFFLSTLYSNPNLNRDIVDGNNEVPGTTLGYVAGPGWDACTGLGVPVGQALFNAFT
jgi:kumamolisin